MSKVEYKVVIIDNYIRWYKLGTDILHREDGPAIEYANGDKRWFLNGLCHREDGPAFEYANGDKRWYLNGIQYSKEEYLKLSNKPSCEGKVVEIDGRKYKLQEI